MKEVEIFEGVVIEDVGVLEVVDGDGEGVEMLEKSGKSSSSFMELSAVDVVVDFLVVLDKSPQLAARFVFVSDVGELF